MDALLFLGKLIASPISLIAARSRLASLIVSILPSEKANETITLDNNGQYTKSSFRSSSKGKIKERRVEGVLESDRSRFMKKFGNNPNDLKH